jgi:hypothetical protein
MVLPIVFRTKKSFCTCWSRGVFIVKDDYARKTIVFCFNDILVVSISYCLPHVMKMLSVISGVQNDKNY